MSKSKRRRTGQSRPRPQPAHASPPPRAKKQSNSEVNVSVRETQAVKAFNRNLFLIAGLCLGLVGITLVVFGRSIHYGFFNYDDSFYVYQNPSISNGLTREGLVKAFTQPLVGNWHPLTSISLMLDASWTGLHAGGYHLVNLLLHLVAVILLFLVLRQMTGAIWPSAWVAAAFAIHPLRAESVVWVSERKDVLSAVFFFAALMFYVRYARRSTLVRYLLVALAFVLGLLSKAMLVTFPFLLLLLDYWPLKRLNLESDNLTNESRRPGVWRIIGEKLLLLLPMIAVSVATMIAQKPALEAGAKFSLLSRAENVVVTIWIYLRQTIWPVHLAVFYPFPKQPFPLWLVTLLLIGLLVLTGLWLRLRKSHPYLIVGWLWYLGMLVPVVGVIQVGWQAHADRYTYLPQVGILIMIAWGLTELAAKFRPLRLLVRGGAVLSLVAMTLVACRQVNYWSSSITLWEHTLAVTTENDVAERGLGTALLAIGRIDDAIAHDRVAVRIRPNDTNGLTNLANALFQKGELPEAIEHFREVMRLRPNDSEVRRNLGKALFSSGALDQSIAEFQAALRIRPNDSDAAYSLGNALLQKGDIPGAITSFRKAIELRPNDPGFHYNLGIALQRAGETDAAISEFRETLQLDRKKADARNNLAISLLKKGATDEAIRAWQTALQIDPGNAELHANLAVAYLNQNQIAATIAQWREALRLQPDKLSIQLSLAWILSTAPEDNIRNGNEAREIAQRAQAASANQNLMTYRVLAAAEAESGDFSAAGKTARDGIEQARARDQETIAQLLEMDLSLYDQSIPLRDPKHGRGGDGER